MKEEYKFWKETNGYRFGKRIYEVSNLGNIKINDKIVDFSYIPNTQYYVVAHNCVHKLVAELFIPNPENKPHVDHIDNNKHNNKVDNLKWVTSKENMNNPITKKHLQDVMIGNKKCGRAGEKHHFYGKHMSDESRKKMSDSRKKYIKEHGQNCSIKGKHRIYNSDGTYHYE